MIDLTEAFQTVVISNGGEISASDERPRPCAGGQESCGEFDALAKRINLKVTSINRLLGEMMPSYADFDTGMDDEERDRIEAVIAEALEDTEDSIGELERASVSTTLLAYRKDLAEHYSCVRVLLIDALRDSQQTVNGARILRQRHVMSSRVKLAPVVTTNDTFVDEQNEAHLLESLDEEELQQLEQENELLHEKLNSELEGAQRIEKTAQQVSDLMALMSDKVLEQHHQLADIYDKAQENNEIIKEVPLHLTRASENGNSFRRFMLIFLLFSGLLLLLLDWVD